MITLRRVVCCRSVKLIKSKSLRPNVNEVSVVKILVVFVIECFSVLLGVSKGGSGDHLFINILVFASLNVKLSLFELKCFYKYLSLGNNFRSSGFASVKQV